VDTVNVSLLTQSVTLQCDFGATQHGRRAVVPTPDQLLDHLVSGHKQGLRLGEAERLGGLEVDDQVELGGLLNRVLGRTLKLAPS